MEHTAGWLAEHSHQEFDSAFDDLLVAWNRHQQMRASSAPVGKLLESRLSIDRLRTRVGSRRKGLVDRLESDGDWPVSRCA